MVHHVLTANSSCVSFCFFRRKKRPHHDLRHNSNLNKRRFSKTNKKRKRKARKLFRYYTLSFLFYIGPLLVSFIIHACQNVMISRLYCICSFYLFCIVHVLSVHLYMFDLKFDNDAMRQT